MNLPQPTEYDQTSSAEIPMPVPPMITTSISGIQGTRSPERDSDMKAITIFFASLMLVTTPDLSRASSAQEINDAANATLHRFVEQNPSAEELGRKAPGVLVFPSVIKAGMLLGGQYGEGVLIAHGNAAGYYNIISASLGFQLGVQSLSIIIVFMTEQSLADFQNAYGWKVGIDGSIVVVTLGAGGSIDTHSLTSPIIAFVTDQEGLMYSLSLEGSKISRIER
jgi:lipid-binding SYLF domain-containing protein